MWRHRKYLPKGTKCEFWCFVDGTYELRNWSSHSSHFLANMEQGSQ
jgi:hypothetical protein